MKKNGNNIRQLDYYIGLDIGTDSVGYAVTDTSYRVMRYGGNSMWGVRLFNEGETAEARRQNRTNRRRLARRNWRLELLRILFDKSITSVDPGFFQRMKESSLVGEDKTQNYRFSLFADTDFTDKDYMRTYPTVYHLRNALMTNDKEFDVRLVYLAVHHIIKSRGHFLYDVGDEEMTFEVAWKRYIACVNEVCDVHIGTNCLDDIHNCLCERCTKSDKVKRIVSMLSYDGCDKVTKKCVEAVVKLIVESKTKPADLLMDDTLDVPSFDFGASEEVLSEIMGVLGDDGAALIESGKSVYDALILERITHGAGSISNFKISEYNRHHDDVHMLKDYIRNCLDDKNLYQEIFVKKSEKNYTAYSGYRKGDREVKCTQEEFCKFLSNRVYRKECDDKYVDMFRRIDEIEFAPKLRTKANGIISNSLHRKELCTILENAAKYLTFLNDRDESGLSTAEKIIKIFDYKLPYFVGPLNTNSSNAWVVRQDGKESEKIYPWNIDSIVDYDASEQKFIERMTSMCTYTGEDVLPKDSLLYSEYIVLNELNGIKVNGQPIDVSWKKKIYEHFFIKQNRKVTIKKIHEFLMNEGQISPSDIVSGVNDPLIGSLFSYHKLKNIIPQIGVEKTEELIRRITLTGAEKSRLRKWIKNNTTLSDEDVQYVCRLNFKEWGRLSEYLLTGIFEVDCETGVALSIIDFMRESNQNLMQLLSDKHTFMKQAIAHKRDLVVDSDSPRKAVDELYISPKVRRGIWQALRVVDEIVDINGAAPKKIFIEVARDQDGKNEKAKTKSRKEQLIELYRACREESGELFDRLQNEEDNRLRGDKLYLYYTQFGKCAYSGEPIDIEALMDKNTWDIDHIFPRSKIKDDSIGNRVLVKAELNREKTNSYPIKPEIQNKMREIWASWLDRGAISKEKYERLVRTTSLTEEELSAFINRQLVETRQSTKAVAELLGQIYSEAETKIVYSKAGNVSDFRQLYAHSKFEGESADDVFVKCRDVNDHHHAKDAYLNIVVGNYFDTRFTSAFFRNIQSEKYSLNTEAMYNYRVDTAWTPGEDGTIQTVRAVMAKNNVLVTRQPREIGGQLYDLQILKAPRGQIEVKQGRSVEKYGGYNKATGAYFALVEQMVKGKRIRSIETILLCDKVQYEKDTEFYVKQKWGEDARVIITKILIGSMFEIDGKRGILTGRTGDQLIFNQSYQLVLSPAAVVQIKMRSRYLERCVAAKRELPLGKAECITAEENIRLYDLFTSKMRGTVYRNWFASLLVTLEKSREKFVSLSIYDQCVILSEILKAFRCNAEHPCLKKIDGPGAAGITLLSKNLKNCKQAYIIHQSPTGLFETKVDLLR